ncbi:CLUMA_CG004864, isoform A [Clunio marinus]|uniref:CLUMA_CG004864, isoform A n=1 Tax=Clunio marinus TaxID=568069 RepID=A0A1J1HT54_9DIPT|nr:CLUMA_CG004864, isoform A [Clunio marinus]
MIAAKENRIAENYNHDNSNEISQDNVTFLKIAKRLHGAKTFSISTSNEKRHFDLFRSKSESQLSLLSLNLEKSIKMGQEIRKSKSCEEMNKDSPVYCSLVKRIDERVDEESFNYSDEDYKLLENSENSSDYGDDLTIIKANNINHYDQDNEVTESRIDETNMQSDEQSSIRNTFDVQCKPFESFFKENNVAADRTCSTFPRKRFRNECFVKNEARRCSLSCKAVENQSRALKSYNKSVNSSELNAPNTSEQNHKEIVESPLNRDDFSSFRRSTLPKTRSRFDEKNSHSRHSLRRTINFTNVTNPGEQHRIVMNCNAIYMPDTESTSEVDVLTSKTKRPRSQFSWLRKSMRKLNPFQLQPSTNSDLEVTPVASGNSNESTSSGRNFHDLNKIPSNVIDDDDDALNDRFIAHHHQQVERRTTSEQLQRPMNPQINVHRSRLFLPSEPSSIATSRNSSPVSVSSSTGSSSVADPITEAEVCSRSLTSREQENESADNLKEIWPHSLSRPISCTLCTLGLFNMSRFAIFSVHFGANFLVQFLILSFIFGIPLLWLQMVLGLKIKGGIVTMYRITPICKGIGIALMISHWIMSLYSSVSISWLMIYFRDSFISSDSQYLWQERFKNYRSYQNNSALKLSENIADYFNGVVLQRLSDASTNQDGKMRFQLAFNVSIVWFLVFILLCRGIRSLGVLVIGIATLGFLGLSAVCIKFLTLLSLESIQDIFPETDWQDFFANSNSWSVAAQEAFLTWGLLGVSVYTIYCKSSKNQRPNPTVLRREAVLIVFLTFFGLFLGAVLGSTCIIILKLNGFNYFPASFENPKNDIFLWPTHQSVSPNFHHSIASKWVVRSSNIVGESFERPVFVNQHGLLLYKESGYKTIRLVTEMLPATLAISSKIEPIWGVIAFGTLILFGVAQLGIMWKPISGTLGNSPPALLLSCITGLFLSFPLTTDKGIVIIHFLDFIFGGAWWLLILWASFIITLFLVRGRPFTSDVLVKELQLSGTLSAFLAFSWSVLLPLALILLSIMEFKKSHSNELFHQRSNLSINYLMNWPYWVKQLGGFLQLSFLILVPCVAIVQIYVYLTKGPPDILDRIELLFRPPLNSPESSSLHTPVRRLANQDLSQFQNTAIALSNTNTLEPTQDPPPKYSPPPSYSKVVGLRVAKALRNSIRRSVRVFRISGEPRTDSIESCRQNIASISSQVPESRDTVRQSFRNSSQSVTRNLSKLIGWTSNSTNNGTQSVENLVLSDLSLNVENSNENNPNNSLGNLI